MAMDERELTTRIKALNKAVGDNEPSTSILGLMETLKRAGAPSEEVLRVGSPSFLPPALCLLLSPAPLYNNL